MANTNLLSTSTQSFNDIMSNGKIYKVPDFQRDYSWNEDNWEDLWNDLMIAHESDEAHYMGAVVLQIEGNERDKIFKIIDGQQRITTLNLLVLAVIYSINELAERGVDRDENRERSGLLMKYLGEKDPASLTYTGKLFLNDNNNEFYKERLLQFRKPVSLNKLSESEKLLWKSYEFFQKHLRMVFKENGVAMATFLSKTVGELLKFIQITVQNELNAYAVFETLNSRGLELTSTDLLKNFLFMLVSKSSVDLNIVKGQWDRIVASVGLKDFPVFLRYYMNTTEELITKDKLFKRIKLKVKEKQDVLLLLDDLERYSNIYTALTKPNDDLWKTDKKLRELIDALNLFRVTVCYPVLLIVYAKYEAGEFFSLSDFKKVLSSIIQISFRFNIIAKLQTNVMEKKYNETAIKISGKIHNNRLTTAVAIINDLKSIYLDDHDFIQYFELANFNTRNSQQKKILRYILYKIEAEFHLGKKLDYEMDDGTIEHILPESLNDEWGEIFSDTDHEKLVYSIGNMTLLEPSKNKKEAGQKSMEEKKKIYSTSEYAMTKSITVNEWTPKTLNHRLEGLAKKAAGIWKIDF